MITKFSAAEWLPDGQSYLYTHFDHEGGAEGTEMTALAGPRLRLHRLGDDQADDRTDPGVPGERSAVLLG